QHAAGESTWVAGRTGAGSRRWNGAARLILLHHTLLWSHVLLWRGVAAAAPGRGRSGSAAGAGLRPVLVVARLRNSRPPAAGRVRARFRCWLGWATLAPPRPPRPLTCDCC